MEIQADEINVQQNTERNRFEVELQGKYAVADYMLVGEKIILTHTEVPKEWEGKGIAEKLAKTALEYARAQGLRVMPLCPYMAVYMKRHAEYQDLLAPGFHLG